MDIVTRKTTRADWERISGEIRYWNALVSYLGPPGASMQHARRACSTPGVRVAAAGWALLPGGGSGSCSGAAACLPPCIQVLPPFVPAALQATFYGTSSSLWQQ